MDKEELHHDVFIGILFLLLEVIAAYVAHYLWFITTTSKVEHIAGIAASILFVLVLWYFLYRVQKYFRKEKR